MEKEPVKIESEEAWVKWSWPTGRGGRGLDTQTTRNCQAEIRSLGRPPKKIYAKEKKARKINKLSTEPYVLSAVK